MRRIAHISDLHFGRTDAAVVDTLIEDLAEQSPDLVVISGDLTQRARHSQFAAARAFLELLPAPHLVVPGNHDIAPLYRPVGRVLDPFRRYRRYISRDLEPSFVDQEIAIYGINSARPLQWKEGRISSEQLTRLRWRLQTVGDNVVRMVCTHHPFVNELDRMPQPVIGKAQRALRLFESCGIDLLLAGHLHRGFHADVVRHHEWLRRSILVVQAGTATSSRRREEPNGYNLIVIEPPHITIEARAWDGSGFALRDTAGYRKQEHRWEPVAV